MPQFPSSLLRQSERGNVYENKADPEGRNDPTGKVHAEEELGLFVEHDGGKRWCHCISGADQVQPETVL